MRSRCATLSLMMGAVAVCQLATAALAQSSGPPKKPEPKPTVIRLSVDPAPEPRPALKYGLVWRMSERKPGNGVPYYYRVIMTCTRYFERSTQKGSKPFEIQIDEWVHTPLDAFPKEEVRNAIGRLDFFDELREATLREECNWDWRLQDVEGVRAISFPLEEVQHSRSVARLLAAKARLEIAEHRYDDAIETLRVGYQFAQDVGKPPILISGLVGMAITAILNEQVDALISSPGAPNLYWALTEIPRPVVDLRPAIELELAFPSRILPFLKDPQHAQHSAQQWADLIADGVRTTLDLAGSGQPSDKKQEWPSRLFATAFAVKGYTQAKHELIAAGWDPKKIESMPVGQVLAIQESRLCTYIADEMRKWTLLPYPEGRAGFKSADSQLIRDHYMGPGFSSREVIPIASLLMPAISQATEAMIRADVSIAARRAIEAIRMQAARNGGKLPASLDEITVVPVPMHPRTGKPFPYRVEGDTAYLEVRRTTTAPAPMQEADNVFEITIAKDRGQGAVKGGR